MPYSQGSTAELEATFTSSYGNPVDPDTVHVDLWDSEGTRVVDNGVPERLSLGTYRYSFAIPEDAPSGLWRIEWQAVVDEMNAFGDEAFVVGSIDVVDHPEQIVQFRLRSRLGEVSRAGDNSDTMFDDDAIADLISYAGGDIDLATYEGWKRKTAHLARLIDVGESGSDRLLSQRFRQAKSMMDFWAAVVSEIEVSRRSAMTGRVTGSVINLRNTGRDDGHPGTPFSGYTEHIRMYPIKRLLIPAILS